MNKLFLVGFLCLFNIVGQGQGRTQGRFSDAERISDHIAENIQRTMPDWKRKIIQPIEGSENVAVDQWISGSQVITISLVVNATQVQAENSHRAFKDRKRNVRDEPSFGAESFSFGADRILILEHGRVNITIRHQGLQSEEADHVLKGFISIIRSECTLN